MKHGCRRPPAGVAELISRQVHPDKAIAGLLDDVGVARCSARDLDARPPVPTAEKAGDEGRILCIRS